MENSFAFNETTLKRIPHFFILILILLLGLPYLALKSGIDFSGLALQLSNGNEFGSQIIELQIRGYFRQILLQWTGFSLSAITVLLSFTLYRLSNDKIAFIIGLSVLFSGSLEALHTLLIDGLSLNFTEKNNLDAVIWIFSNSMSGLILLGGLVIILNTKDEKPLPVRTFILITSFLVLIAVTAIYYAADVIQLPHMWFQDRLLSRPYELISIAIYMSLILFVYPKAYNAYPTILVDCIFYIAVTQIVISIYLMLLSNSPYDGAYNIAYFLKTIAYLIPCVCLIINYIFSYSSVLNAQKRLKIKQEELRYIASHDSLTNLFNRREFEELLDKSIALAHRDKTSIGLLLIDLDNFKTTNDTFGHIHGDELLKQFAKRLDILIRKGDLLSRVGGDEFTLITLNLKGPSGARMLAERILSELNIPYTINGKLITVSVSIGISIYPDNGHTTEELLRKADLAMYKSKNSGKNTYNFYTEQLNYQQHRESEVEAHLRKALKNDEFELYYQPKYHLRTQEIIGAEILLRWHNNVLGNVSPAEFIPVAEKTGLIIDVGNWVLNKACKQTIGWTTEFDKNLLFSINISPIQLSHNQFLLGIEKAMNDYNYPSSNLEFEITENFLMNDSEDLNHILMSISAMGIKLALDDFGTAYSSLNRLRTLPIDSLKIDKSFISDIRDPKNKVVIVDIIIKLASELGMDIIAEGIETEEQLQYLISKKCTYGQGFLLSKPIPADEFAALAYEKHLVRK